MKPKYNEVGSCDWSDGEIKLAIHARRMGDDEYRRLKNLTAGNDSDTNDSDDSDSGSD